MKTNLIRNIETRNKINELIDLGVSLNSIAKGCKEYHQNMSKFRLGRRNMNDFSLNRVDRYLNQFEAQVQSIIEKGE